MTKKKKLVTINIDLEDKSEQEMIKDLLEQGERVAALMDNPMVQKKKELDAQIEIQKKKISTLRD